MFEIFQTSLFQGLCQFKTRPIHAFHWPTCAESCTLLQVVCLMTQEEKRIKVLRAAVRVPGFTGSLWSPAESLKRKETREEGVIAVSQKRPCLKSWVVRLEHKMSVLTHLMSRHSERAGEKKFKMRMLSCSYYKVKHLDIAMQAMQSHCGLK